MAEAKFSLDPAELEPGVAVASAEQRIAFDNAERELRYLTHHIYPNGTYGPDVKEHLADLWSAGAMPTYVPREEEEGTFPEPKSPGWSTKGRKNG